VVPKDQTDAIADKLGGRIKKLSNTFLSVHGKSFQVNTIECMTLEEAEKIRKTILGMKGHPAFCLRQDNLAVEFVGDDVSLAIKGGYELGFRPKPNEVRYRISFDAAPIEKGDFMSWNRLFNLFSEANASPNDEKLRLQIAELSKRFQFSNEIELRTCGNEKTKAVY
jgi:hypothetical protein